MSFNKGYELKKFEAHWEKLCIEYAAAGMTEEAIQKMYDYDRQQFNSERTFIERIAKVRYEKTLAMRREAYHAKKSEQTA